MPLTSLAVAVLTLALVITSQERPINGATVQTSVPMSASVFATFIAHGDPSSVPPPGQPPADPPHKLTGPLTLDLVVLWRGAPGWYLEGDHQAASGGGDAKGHIAVHLQRGSIDLDLTFDRQAGVVHVGETEVVLAGANVVLVDGVDVPGGLTIAGTRSVGPHVEDLKMGMYAVPRGAPDLIPFLRCDVRLEDPGGRGSPAGIAYLQQVLDANCARIMGK